MKMYYRMILWISFVGCTFGLCSTHAEQTVPRMTLVKEAPAKPKNPGIESQIHDLTRELDEALGKSAREFDRLLPQVEQRLRELEGAVAKHGPALRKRLENMLEQLQERLRRDAPVYRSERNRSV